MTDRPYAVRAEHRPDSLGIGVRRPRLSWRLPAGAGRQLGYELRRDDGVRERVADEANVLVPWIGPALVSRERRTVQVRVETATGWSDWSEPLAVEAGLLEPGDWRAGWVAPPTGTEPPGHRPAYALRGTFELRRPVARARLHVTAHGLVEPWLDGERVGTAELLPGYTEYHHHTLVHTLDVTDRLGAGPHVLGALLADGWYRGQVGMTRAADQWGDTTAVLAQLVVTSDDGGTQVVGTGPHWRWSPCHVLAADLIEGQAEDRRLVQAAWCTPSYDASGWHPVSTPDRGLAALVASPAPPVRPVEELAPRAVTRPRPGVHVIDLGQNVNGRLRVRDLGPVGTRIGLTHGEALGQDGDVTMEHLQPDVPFLPEPLSAGQVDSVVSAGVPGDVFEPRFTTHGFRYVRVEGHPGPLGVEDVTGVVVHTDLERRGSFACSDERLNRLHEAAVWSFRGNACDIPTDCPTRERAGWTGDWQLFVPTATFLYDVAGFSVKWLRDLAATQWEDGNLGNMAPMPVAERTGILEKLNGSAGWGDAVVLVPWELWSEYGDAGFLAELWPSMVRWLDRTERMAAARRHPDRVARRGEPAPHERYLWDSGFHWGEWLEPGAEPADFAAFAAADKAEVATAFFARSTRQAAAVAEVLGRTADARRYAALSDAVVDAWRAEFLDAGGPVVPHTGEPGPRAGLRPGARRASAAGGRRPRSAGPRGGDAPRHGLPLHAGPAAGARRPRPPRPGLRAAAPGLRALVAGDDRPRRYDGVGALGRRRRRRRAARVAQPLLEGSDGVLPAPLRRRAAADFADLADVPRRAATRWRAHLGARPARLAARAGRVGMDDRGRLVRA